MKERIDIVAPEDKLAANEDKRERLRRAGAFESVDRVPVVLKLNQWAKLAARGVSCGDYTRSPRENLRHQLLNHKWRIENIHDDQPVDLEAIGVSPDLGCLRGTEFAMDVTWPPDQPPKCAHPLQRPEQIDDLELPPPDASVNGRLLAWYRQMCEMAGDFDLRLNGEPLELRVGIGHGGGPIPAAFALAGQNLFLWLASEPERARRLLELVTESHLRCVRFFDEIAGRPLEHGVGMGCDTGEMLSAPMFRAEVLPHYERVWQAYPGSRSLHMCGQIKHLLALLRDEMRITDLNGFGFPVDPRLLAEEMGGRVVLRGGPSPMLVHRGPVEAIEIACRQYIEILAPTGGFIMSLGGGSVPDTPVHHLEAMVQASRQAA